LYVASARQLLGEVLLQRGAYGAAQIELRDAVELNMALAGPDNWRTARAQASLAWALIEGGKSAEGEPMLLAARQRLIIALGSQHEASRQAGTRLAQYYRSRHRDAEAARVLAAQDSR
jgi:hypothetical protein